MAGNWLQFVNKHLKHLTKSPELIEDEKKAAIGEASKTAAVSSNEKGHQRSKSAFVVSTLGLMDHRKRSRTRSGSIYQDCLEQATLSGSKETVSSGRGCEESGEEEPKAEGRKRLIEMNHGLHKLVKITTLVASRTLSVSGSTCWLANGRH